MAQVINSNIASLNSQRNLSTSQASLSTSLQRLSSGLRINSAKDDAAGLAISERFSSQIRGNQQAARNANDGISLAQTAEGGLSTAGDLLQRIRELAVQSANGTNSDSDRASIQNEVSSLSQELDRVANTTQFNGQNVLDGSLTAAQFQVGANANQTINVGVQSARATDIGNNTLKSVMDGTTSNSSSATATGANVIAQQDMTFTSGTGTSTLVKVEAGQSAKKIAATVNALSNSSGVKAEAITTATIAGATGAKIADGSIQFQLRGNNSVENDANSTAVTISANVKGGDLSPWHRRSTPKSAPPASARRSRPMRRPASRKFNCRTRPARTSRSPTPTWSPVPTSTRCRVRRCAAPTNQPAARPLRSPVSAPRSAPAPRPAARKQPWAAA